MWSNTTDVEQKYMYELVNMKSAVSPSCAAAILTMRLTSASNLPPSYKKGTADNKWLYWFLHSNDDMRFMKTVDVSDVHHVLFELCDVNFFMGDLADPFEYNGQ